MEAIAKKYGLKFFKVDNAANSTNLPDLNSAPDVTSAVFAAPKGSITDVVGVEAAGKAAYAEVTNITPSRVANFDEVQAQVTDRYTNEEAGRLDAGRGQRRRRAREEGRRFSAGGQIGSGLN